MKLSVRVMMMVEYHVMRFYVAPGTSIMLTIGIFAHFGCDEAHALAVTWLTGETPVRLEGAGRKHAQRCCHDGEDATAWYRQNQTLSTALA
jgi:hypothetical protein